MVGLNINIRQRMKVQLNNISKSFGSVNVLKSVSLTIKPGTIHALMGENGAGKSTIIKVLGGVHKQDEGEVIIDDTVVDINNIRESMECGIAYVHQELNVVDTLTVVESMFLGSEIKKKYGFLDYSSMKSEVIKVFDKLKLKISPDAKMKDLTVGNQQMVEIAKSLLFHANVIILDEPTAALSNKEISSLFDVIKELNEQGVSFIYVSHRMNEIFEISDEISVIRDGIYIGTVETKQCTEDKLITMMIGKSLTEIFSNKALAPGEEILRVKGLCLRDTFSDIDFTLKRGEVLGFSGLMGAGRSELMHSLFGSVPYDTGEIFIEEKKVTINSPIDAVKHGIAFVTEDRKNQGLILHDSIRDNITLPNLKKYKVNGIIQDRKLNEAASLKISELNIKCESGVQSVSKLSGGNQQKVVLAKWLETCPKILILDEPTRGVDIGSKKEIYQIINNLKEAGNAIIIVSSDLYEIIGVSDRIAVMRNGKIEDILYKDEVTEEKVLKLAFTGK